MFKAWLDAQGDKELVRPALEGWLAIPERAQSPEASFVFKAWLDAQGHTKLIARAVEKWLEVRGNAQSQDAGFLFRSWGDKEKRLPQWMEHPAETWFLTWLNTEDPIYPLKYITQIRSLSATTIHAIVKYCHGMSDSVDALHRLNRLSPDFGVIAERGFLIEIVSEVVDKAVKQDRKRGTPLVVFSGARCIARICALPLRDEHARSAFIGLAHASFHLLQHISWVKGLSFQDCSPDSVDAMVSVNWEDLIKRALQAGAPKDEALRRGLMIWCDLCKPYASTGGQAMYTRLRDLAN